MNKKPTTNKNLSEIVSVKSLNYIKTSDREIMINAMKKMIEDLNSIELTFASMDISADETMRLKRFINDNRIRARKVIWGLTSSCVKDLSEIRIGKDIINSKEEEP